MIVSLELEENSTLNANMWEAAGLQGSGTFPLDRFSYNNSALLEVIFRHVQATNFTGITVSEGGGGECEKSKKREEAGGEWRHKWSRERGWGHCNKERRGDLDAFLLVSGTTIGIALISKV